MRHDLIYNDMHNPHCVISRQARPPVKNAQRPVSQRSAIISRLLDLDHVGPAGQSLLPIAGWSADEID